MRILIIATRDPRGPATGRKIVLRTIIRSLRALGHDVRVLAFGRHAQGNTRDESLGASIQVLNVPSWFRVAINVVFRNVTGRRSLNECLYFSPVIRRRVTRLAAEYQADLVVADMVRTAEYAEMTGFPWFVDLDDLLSNRYEIWCHQGFDPASLLGYYGKEIGCVTRSVASRLVARLLRREAKVLRRREIDVARRASGVSLVSEPEARSLQTVSGRSVFCLPMALEVPEGGGLQLWKRPIEMVFTGGLEYKPNLEGIDYYARHVAPVLAKEGLNHLRLSVYGQCPESVRSAYQSAHLRFHGYVDDLYGALAGYQLFVAPLRSGSGVKTKIVEAMLFGLPVVTTPVGVQGLSVSNGEHCYVGETPEDLVRILRHVEETPDEAVRVGEAGRRFAQERFSAGVLVESWRRALESVMVGRQEGLGEARESICGTR